MTVSRYLPAEAKAKPRGDSNKILQTRDKTSGRRTFQAQQVIEEIRPEDYDNQSLESYPKEFLIEIIHYLENQLSNSENKQYQAVIKQVEYETKQQTKNYYSPQLANDSPRQVTVNECLAIRREKQQLTFEDTVREACQPNQQVAAYIGTNYITKTNVKLTSVVAAP